MIIGGVLLLVMGTACACSNLDDDDDCDSLGPSETVLAASHSGLAVGQLPDAEIFAAGSSGVRMAPPAPSDLAAVPANGGFGTHLASCGG
ncbi:MAG TPA: hypothetical protein DGG94_10960 [Micromonosporaceae bacterium]|nr:hypothetical protein [Micromonosporaceae bacterium]HCU50299.1 hypothetical protein [Micromonosporaceae bacterium]